MTTQERLKAELEQCKSYNQQLEEQIKALQCEVEDFKRLYEAAHNKLKFMESRSITVQNMNLYFG